jgi:hypothetical protein
MDVMGKREEMHSENGFLIYKKSIHLLQHTSDGSYSFLHVKPGWLDPREHVKCSKFLNVNFAPSVISHFKIWRAYFLRLCLVQTYNIIQYGE